MSVYRIRQAFLSAVDLVIDAETAKLTSDEAANFIPTAEQSVVKYKIEILRDVRERIRVLDLSAYGDEPPAVAMVGKPMPQQEQK